VVFDDETVVAGVNRRHEEACFPGVEEPSRGGAIPFNGSVIFMIARKAARNSAYGNVLVRY
jgi:hypothetical protein